MLAPALATMLVYLTTDADVDAATADRALREATRLTFDRLDSDGCMSTNDTVLLMASGASGVVPDEAEFAASRPGGSAMTSPSSCCAMPRAPTTTSRSRCWGPPATRRRVEVGRAVARSALFKCAIYGKDPNWGRVSGLHRHDDRGLRPAGSRRRDERRLGVPQERTRRVARPGRPRSAGRRRHDRPEGGLRARRPSGPTT